MTRAHATGHRASVLTVAALACTLVTLPNVHAAAFDLEVSGQLDLLVSIANLTMRAGAAPAPQAEACTAQHYAPDQGQSRFTFQEGPQDAGCLGVLYNVTLPQGVRRLTVSFEADRLEQGPTTGTPLGPAALEQEVRLRAAGQELAAIPYFGTAAASAAAQPFRLTFTAPTTDFVEIEWWFANRGEASSMADRNSERLQAWSATISGPEVHLEGIPLASPQPQSLDGRTSKLAYTAKYAATLAVPEEYRAAAAAGQFALDIRMPMSLLVDRLEDNTGRNLQDDEFETSMSGTSRHVILPAATLAELGPGPYTLHFQASETLQLTTPMTFAAVIAILLPAVGLILAAAQLRRRLLEPVLDAADGLEDELGPS